MQKFHFSLERLIDKKQFSTIQPSHSKSKSLRDSYDESYESRNLEALEKDFGPCCEFLTYNGFIFVALLILRLRFVFELLFIPFFHPNKAQNRSDKEMFLGGSVALKSELISECCKPRCSRISHYRRYSIMGTHCSSCRRINLLNLTARRTTKAVFKILQMRYLIGSKLKSSLLFSKMWRR